MVGFFTAMLGGAAPMISGPSAIVTIFTAVIIGTYADDLAEAFTIVMLAGLLQIAFGALRLGRFVNWLPVSVVRGVFVGVGCYIFMSQTLWFLGAPVEPGIGLIAIIASWPQAVANLNGDALAVALITLAVFIVWPPRLHRMVPNALTALIIDPITGRTHKPDRELFGLGVGNIAAGLIGGLPGAASAPCSLLAARSGGRSLITGVVCAALLLAVLFGLGSTLSWIPHAAFAGILIKVGWEMMDIRVLRRIPRLSADIGIVTLLTAALSIFFDVISAIAVGVFRRRHGQRAALGAGGAQSDPLHAAARHGALSGGRTAARRRSVPRARRAAIAARPLLDRLRAGDRARHQP